MWFLYVYRHHISRDTIDIRIEMSDYIIMLKFLVPNLELAYNKATEQFVSFLQSSDLCQRGEGGFLKILDFFFVC